jgi:orotate phosphoribosyltransferase
MIELAPLNTEGLTRLIIGSGAVRVASQLDELITLRQGIVSGIYVDCGDILTDPETNTPFVHTIADYVDRKFGIEPTIICNVDSKASSLGHTVATLLGTRHIAYGSESVQQAERGTERRVRLPKRTGPGDTIVVLDDVLTEGDTTASDAVTNVRNALRERADQIAETKVHLVTPLFRGNPKAAREQLGALGIQAHWFVTLEPVVKRMWRRLTPAQRDILMEVDHLGPY